MLPVLYRFTFDTELSRVLLYLFCAGLVVYGAWNGWRTAFVTNDKGEPIDPNSEAGKTKEFALALAKERQKRLLNNVLTGLALSAAALYYALPNVPFIGRGKGEGIPLHTYGIMIGLGFLTALTAASQLSFREWPGKVGAERRDQFFDLVFYLFIGGILGSHDLFVLVNWKEYTSSTLKSPEAWAVVLDLLALAVLTAVTLGRERFFTSAESRKAFVDNGFRNFMYVVVGGRVLFAFMGPGLKAIPEMIGGLVFYGGLIGATIAALWYCLKYGIEFMRLADVAIPTVSLGQAFGRLGCFSAGCCWGDITTHEKAPFAVEFPGGGALNLFGGVGGTPSLAYSSQSNALEETRWVLEKTGEVFPNAVDGAVRISEWASQHGHTLPVHPTQLYESAGQIVLFTLLMTARRWRRFHGQIFALWLMCYAVLRSSVELFRGDLERGTLHGLVKSIPTDAWYNISISQFISMAMFSLGAWLLVKNFKAIKAQPPVDLGALTAA